MKETSGACSTYGKEKICVQIVVGKYEERNTQEK
jgi:hypothetical protein